MKVIYPAPFIITVSATAAQDSDLLRNTIWNCISAVEVEEPIETRLLSLGWNIVEPKEIDDLSLSGYRLANFPENFFGQAHPGLYTPARIGHSVISATQLENAWRESHSLLPQLRERMSAPNANETTLAFALPGTSGVLLLELHKTSGARTGRCTLAVTKSMVGQNFDYLLGKVSYPINYLQVPQMDSDLGRKRDLRAVLVKQDDFGTAINETFPFVAVYWTANELQEEE